MVEELLGQEEDIYIQDKVSTKELYSEVCHSVSNKIITKPINNSTYHKILRYIIIGTISIVTFFLLTYSTYLIVIQYFLNIESKYNQQILNESRIFFEIDVVNYNFNTSCLYKSQSIICIISNLKHLKEYGVTDLILVNTFNYDYDISSEFGDERLLKKLLQKADKYGIAIHLDIERKPKGWINKRNNEKDNSDNIIHISHNNSCIDMYFDDVTAVIERFASLGIDGFVINDIPCCVQFPHYFNSRPKNCSFSAFKTLRKIARKEGKPSSLIYRPKYQIYHSLIEKISYHDCAHFDAIIKYAEVDGKGNIEIPPIPELKPSLFPHTIWTTKITKSNYTKVYDCQTIYQLPSIFFPGSFLYVGDYKKRKTNKTYDTDVIYSRYKNDAAILNFASTAKKLLTNISCVSNQSSFITQHYGDNTFVAIQQIKGSTSQYCVLVINLSDVQTKIYVQSRFNQTQFGAKKATPLISIESRNIQKLPPTSQNALILKPKSAQIFKL